MPWFRIDDQMAFHAKVVAAGNAAIGLWARAGSWSASALTDGFVPKHMIAPLGTNAQAKKLVNVGLWSEVEGGFQFHQWAERQPFTKEDVERKREDARERMRAAREAKRQKRSQDVRANSDENTERTDAEPAEHDNENTARSSLNPNPTQPNPTEVPTGTSKGEARKRAPAPDRGHRLPDDWKPDEAVIRQMRDQFPHVDLRTEHAKFADYWNDQPGAKGRKVDWNGTWRNWIRRAAESGPARSRSNLTSREEEFVKAELMKDNPNLDVLRRAGFQPATHLIALPGGA